nr:hypothetical protein [Tanacetum cinerariifolium]
MSFSKRPRKNTSQCYTKPFDSLKNWNSRFFWVDERIFLTVVEWCINASKDKMPSVDSYSEADVTTLNTHRTPIQKQPKALLCLVGLSQSYFLGDDVYPTFLYDDDRGGAPNPTNVKTRTRLRATHEVPLLTATASRVIDIEDIDIKSKMDCRMNSPVENATTTEVALEPILGKKVAAMGPRVNKRRHKNSNDKAKANASPKDAPTATNSVSDPDPLSYAKPQPLPELDIAQSSRKTATEVPTRNVTTKRCKARSSRRVWSKGNQPPSPPWVGRQEVSISRGLWKRKCTGLRNQTKNLETLLEAEVDMKKAVEAKNAKLAKELESLRVQFSDLYVSNNQLSQQADSKYVKALQDLKDLKYPLVDQLERLKDAPMELIMASLNLESDSKEDAS